MHDDDPHPLLPDATELTRLDESSGSTPERIGNYRILQKLGEGGMGIVYEAEQERPVRRPVALKVIKLGMDTEQVVVRFESERQALALMSHPNIARVYDAGATAEGRPFFAMECFRGVAITEYCDRRKLSMRDRLTLFMAVCDGVQHAHQKGIIHRDIKPSNVLVRDEDGKHVPKIIDFGIAKATARRLTEKTFFTEMGQLIGTPEYMSPEQAEMSGIDIDTRTDVYQLGVLLYELLTGNLLFGEGELRRVGFNEFRRKVLEDEPLRPSTRVTSVERSDSSPRPPEPRALSRTLKGDLDWITMKALEKDRTRRYSSASELAADIGRHLRSEPVLAGPPGNLYRIRKFAMRHRAGVAFASVLLVLLAGFAGTMTVQRLQIARARDLAAQERDRATQEAETAHQVARFLSELFKSSDPGQARGREISAREILDRGSARIRDELKESPAVQARLMSIMGDVYNSHGLREQARNLLEDALAIQHRRDDDPLETSSTLQRLGGVLLYEGEFDRARRLYEEALEIRRAALAPDDSRLAGSINAMANVRAMTGDFEGASALYDEAFRIWEKKDPDHPDLATMLSNRAMLLKKSGQLEAARPLLERALGIRRRAFGSDHPKVEWNLNALGLLLGTLGELSGARAYYEQSLAIREQIYAPPHPKVAESLVRLAMLAAREGRLEQAESLHQRAVEIYAATGAGQSPFVLYDEAGYAALTGDSREALRLLRRAVLEHDYGSVDQLRRDVNLRSLADEPGFDSIVSAVADRESGARDSGSLPGHQPGE